MSPILQRSDHRQKIEFTQSLTEQEIEELASAPDIRSIQCSSPVDPLTWDLLNWKLFRKRPEIQLRVYGFHQTTCDLSFVSKMSNVRRFAADCLMNANGIEHLAALEQLEQLSIGIDNLDSFDFLNSLPAGITSLSLGATKSKKPRLDSLSRFQSLRKLYLERQQNQISALAELKHLEDLTLRSITTPNLEYIASLPDLWSLDIKLGGIKDLSAISCKENIKYLELWQVRGLSNLSFVSSLTGLQFLFLQSLADVTHIPDLSRLTRLRRIYLENMRGLKDVDGISTAPALEQFIHISAQNIQPEQYKNLLAQPSLRGVTIGFGSEQNNQKFQNLAAQAGKRGYESTRLSFNNMDRQSARHV